MKKFFLPLFALFLFALTVMTVRAEGAITVSDQDLTYDFPKSMTFTASAASDANIEKMTLIIRFPTVTRRVQADITPAKEVDARIEWNLDTENSSSNGGYIPPGVSATYTWLIQDAAGMTYETKPETFTVEDNRIAWQTVENDDLAIHWYGAGKDYGQAIYDAGIETLKQVRQELGAGTGGKVHIWFYTDREDFRTSMPDMNVWTGGRSFGEYRVIILLNEPIDSLDAVRGARHELTHQIIFDSLGGGLARQAFPHWMNEGLAVYNESGDRSLVEYIAGPLNQAIANDDLPTLKSREANFPPDSQEALVSYGMSYAVVDMLFREFGNDKVQEMYRSFQEGVPSDETFTRVFGMDTNGLDNMYRKSVGLAERNFSGSGAATPRAIPTFALSGADTPPSSSGSKATPTPRSVAAANTPAPAVATAAPAASGSSAGESGGQSLCGIGLGGMALAMVGGYAWRKRRRPKLF